MPWGAVAAIGGALISSGAQSDAAESAANSSREATDASSRATGDRLAFDKQQYAEGAADRAFASELARTTATQQAADRAKYNALQDEQIVRGRVYQGEEDRLLGEAQKYDTPERRAAAQAEAMAGVEQQVSAQRAASNRDLERSGVAPGSGKQLALQGGINLGAAKLKAGASAKAGKDVETQGYARRMDAVGLGKGLVGNQATQAGLQLNAGNSSVTNGQVPLKVAGSANDVMSLGFGNAASAYSGLAGLQSGNFYKANAYGAGVGSSVGSALGGTFQSAGGGAGKYGGYGLGASGGAGFGTLAYSNAIGATGGDSMGALINANGW